MVAALRGSVASRFAPDWALKLPVACGLRLDRAPRAHRDAVGAGFIGGFHSATTMGEIWCVLWVTRRRRVRTDLWGRFGLGGV
jgi:hypothetical protein